MDDVVAALAEEQDELTRYLDALDGAGWEAPSRCAGWSVADVVLHVTQSNELAIASLQDEFTTLVGTLLADAPAVADVDDAAEHFVQRERGIAPADLLARWQDRADQLLGLLRASDGHRRVDWVSGRLSVHTLATTRLAETWIHSGDVIADLAPTDRLVHIARLAWRTLPYAFAGAGRELSGPVAFDLVAPSGDRWQFGDESATTTIRGRAHELCLVAARRAEPAATGLEGEGPDASLVLDLVRTYA